MGAVRQSPSSGTRQQIRSSTASPPTASESATQVTSASGDRPSRPFVLIGRRQLRHLLVVLEPQILSSTTRFDHAGDPRAVGRSSGSRMKAAHLLPLRSLRAREQGPLAIGLGAYARLWGGRRRKPLSGPGSPTCHPQSAQESAPAPLAMSAHGWRVAVRGMQAKPRPGAHEDRHEREEADSS